MIYLLYWLIMFLFSYFSMTVLITDRNNVTNNFNKVYMSLMMIFFMLFMHNYEHNLSLAIIFIILTIAIGLLVRYQVFINDEQFLLSMIEHHQMALDMATKIKEKTKDKKIIDLADNIIENQTKEIKMMWNIIPIR